MDLTPLRCLVNSISRFIHLVTCRVSNTMPAEKDFRDTVSLLKHLKPVLDDVANQEAPQDEALLKECEVLDIAINEAREFLEKWSPRMSKILCVLQSKPLFLKIQSSSVQLSCILCRLFESSPTSSSLSKAQFCMQEIENLKLGQLSKHIEEILECQKDLKIPGEHLMKIIESLHLTSSQDLLNEHIALEKEKLKAEDNNTEGDLGQISQTLDLMSRIRDYVVGLEKFKAVDGIRIPSHFRCPLSLELMLDPVIVSSGQTFERAAIQKWLDHGLERCPKTGYKLSHKNLIPNHTVKALITTWCSENKVKLSSSLSHGDDHQRPLQSGDSASKSSVEAQKGGEKGHQISRGESDKFDQSSPEHSYVHSRSESESSAVSSIEYAPAAETEISRISNNQDNVNDKSVDIKSESGYDELTSTSHVEKLINALKCSSTETQTAAARELRFLAKYNMENRIIIGECGAIAPLISLLHSDVGLTQEHAVTALLNLSINGEIKARIAAEGALDPLIHVLRTGNSGAKENAAAALFSISLLDEYRIKIGRSGAVKPLVDLLGSGTTRGKKDAATALFNLSIFHENKARIVQAGAVKHLVRLMDPTSEMVDKAVALLANLSTITEGYTAIAREGGIPLLVEIVDTGSQRGKENAASILLQMSINSSKYCRSVLQEGAVPPLVALSQCGTPRAKEKAQQLLSHFRNQRENAVSRGRS
ncbi:hypothetical protein ACS0TY_007351 [Phlomoides rotata]